MRRHYDGGFPAYVPVAQRRSRAAAKVRSMKNAGRDVSPVQVSGRKIATTFWGEAWCGHLEAYSDYANRLPRGRTYVRNGSVLDLQIEAGRVRTLVSGSDLYTVKVTIRSLDHRRWARIKERCAGQIDSLVELLRGSLSKGVMEIVTHKEEGLFPSPREITLACSCPDWATMCKHVAATLYGVGARLDREPELLFTLRGVDPTELVDAALAQPTGRGKARKGRVLETDNLSALFGVDIGDGSSAVVATPTRKPKATVQGRADTPAKKAAAQKKPKNIASAKKAPERKTRAKASPAKTSKVAKAGSPKAAAKGRTARRAASTEKPVAKKATKKTR